MHVALPQPDVPTVAKIAPVSNPDTRAFHERVTASHIGCYERRDAMHVGMVSPSPQVRQRVRTVRW
jgi:hypothetical protein